MRSRGHKLHGQLRICSLGAARGKREKEGKQTSRFFYDA